MNPRIRIILRDFELTATAELCVEDAPQASEMLLGLLRTPVLSVAIHAIYAGPAVLVDIPARHGEPRGGQIPVENQTDSPRPGDLLLLPPPVNEEDLARVAEADDVTLAVFYGDHGRPLTPQGWQPGVRVGLVVEGLEELREVCRRIRFEGACEVRLAREPEPGEVETAVLYTDGASRGNPGPAGAGFVLATDDGMVLAEGSVPLAPTTVNVAEYAALVAGLEEALRQGVRRLELRMDSELIIRQLTGAYRVRAPQLQPMFREAKQLIERFEEFTCRHIPREMNRRADQLAGDAARRMKEKRTDDVD